MEVKTYVGKKKQHTAPLRFRNDGGNPLKVLPNPNLTPTSSCQFSIKHVHCNPICLGLISFTGALSSTYCTQHYMAGIHRYRLYLAMKHLSQSSA